jgi:transcriptional regulator with XRE-family HTH domain
LPIHHSGVNTILVHISLDGRIGARQRQAMQLRAYIDRHTTVADFARRIGVKPQTVYRYMDGQRVPRPRVMEAIMRETKHAVLPSDFYPVVRGAA